MFKLYNNSYSYVVLALSVNKINANTIVNNVRVDYEN